MSRAIAHRMHRTLTGAGWVGITIGLIACEGAGDGEPVVGLTPAPDLGEVRVVPNRSSVILEVPVVAGARDYRVFALAPGVVATSDGAGREHLAGATITCAGRRQRNQCSRDAQLPIRYENELLDLPDCTDPGHLDVATPVMTRIEVNGVAPGTTFIVEALDRLCPFPGLLGNAPDAFAFGASDLGGPMVDVVVDGAAYAVPLLPATFPVRTEAEIRAGYGSMIYNGQGPNLPVMDPASPAFPESPYVRVGQPAPADDPVVLARATITASPLDRDAFPPGIAADDYFDDFADDDQPQLVRASGNFAPVITGQTADEMALYQTARWNLYSPTREFGQVFVDHGQLHMIFGDPAQGSMATQAMYPRRPVALPTAADRYLHVTYEVTHNESARRYEAFSLCGADAPGQTYDGEIPRSAPLPRPGFMNAVDTTRTSPLGWNCLYLVPRGNGYGLVPGGDVPSHSDTSMKVTVVASHPAPTTMAEYDGVRIAAFARNVGPDHDVPYPDTWVRAIDATGAPAGPLLDDVLSPWLRTRFDVYVRRDRVILYANGTQRLCANLQAAPLTMAEGALGLWSVLYHSSAEFAELRAHDPSSRPSTGQHHILANTPFATPIQWDNVGFREDDRAPGDFDAARCLP